MKQYINYKRSDFSHLLHYIATQTVTEGFYLIQALFERNYITK